MIVSKDVVLDMGEGDGEVCEVEPCPQQDLNELFSNSDLLHYSGRMKMMNY